MTKNTLEYVAFSPQSKTLLLRLHDLNVSIFSALKPRGSDQSGCVAYVIQLPTAGSGSRTGIDSRPGGTRLG